MLHLLAFALLLLLLGEAAVAAASVRQRVGQAPVARALTSKLFWACRLPAPRQRLGIGSPRLELGLRERGTPAQFVGERFSKSSCLLVTGGTSLLL